MFHLNQRASGVLLHPTSLPGAHGSGDLGPEGHGFVRWLHDAGQRWWQMLPIGPLGYGNSPYSAQSAFAGNPLLIGVDGLVEAGLLPRRAAAEVPQFPQGRVDYPAAAAWRGRMLRTAFTAFRRNPAYDRFVEENSGWLEDFALFSALKRAHQETAWTDWEIGVRAREPKALAAARERLREELELHRFEQFLFEEQWQSLRRHAASLGVGLIGDMPIYVAHDSAEVWAHPEVFFLDDEGRPTAVAGVPPDYFSATGQRWGNPLYRWDALARDGFRWWVQRFENALHRFDAVRLDHFIGFTRYWEVPANEATAMNGSWKPGPGAALFEAVRAAHGSLPLIAEDLGAVTPEVTALRDRLGLPGIKLLQFAFGTDPQAPTFLPYNYARNSVAYTGTHDNDTTAGWFQEKGSAQRSAAQSEKERRAVLDYLGSDGREIHWDMIRGVWTSVANVAIVPMQDLLGLGTEARMNLPGTATGNWEWRLRPGQPDARIAQRLRELTRTSGRSAA